jgi:hypothetical protein
MSQLPSQVESGNLDVAVFSKQLDPLMSGPVMAGPASDLAAAIPVCAHNLQNPSPEVRKFTMLVLTFLAPRPDGSDILAPLIPQINQALTHERDGIQASALLILTYLEQKMPDSSAALLEQITRDEQHSTEIRVGAVYALMGARPFSEKIRLLA